MIWFLYGSISVLIISLTGLALVICLPSLQSDHQSNLSQIFVGLAVGTLCSDALLHLLPHAFSSQVEPQDSHHLSNDSLEDHHDDGGGAGHHHHHHHHTDSVWSGLLALAGIIGFLVFERLTIILTDLFISNREETDKENNAKCSTGANYLAPEMELLNNHNDQHEMKELTQVINGDNVHDLQVHDECHRSTISYPKPNGEGYIHIAAHHHHHHKIHRGPSSALMVLFGDLVHNLFDGLAIGVAFAGSGITGGISTSLAVFCHELPHELGDFTIIIRSGMSLKSVIVWNIIASIICWLGMVLGILLGTQQSAWLSALIAGTFLYISLVDMVPELDSCPQLPSKSRAVKLTVQLVGILIGTGIMLVISLFEDKVHQLFQKVTMFKP